MRLVAVSIVFYALSYGAPLPSPDDSTDDLTWSKDGISIEFAPEGHSVEYDFDYEEEPPEYEVVYYEDDAEEYDEPNDPVAKWLTGGDDEAFAPIFQHVEDILESDTSAREQLERILDAIVHHQESVPEVGQQDDKTSRSSDDVVREILRILASTEQNEEKISLIFTEITSNTKHSGSIEFSSDDPDAVVLRRIKWILDGPESAQRRTQMMLEELADHLHPERESAKYGSGVDTDVQETLTPKVTEPIILESDQDITADVLEDVDKDYNTRYGF